MVLAAGVGSRLKPLTDASPKALIEVKGKTMLELVLSRLIAAGVTEVIVNVFHLGGQIEAFLKARKHFGIRVEVSREDVLLDTGGGLKKASWFFDDGKPFFVHNVDVLSDIDLRKLHRFHCDHQALATLAVMERETKRGLKFDAAGVLKGRDPAGSAFCGIHVVSPAIFPKLTETGVFPIVDAYIRLAGQGERIQAYRADGATWRDIGGLEKLEEARRL